MSMKKVELIKEQISKGKCQFVGLEIPSNMMLTCNLYIHNLWNDSIERILPRNCDIIISKPCLIDLLEWMRKYNQKSDDKVYVLGIDVVKERYGDDLKHFFSSLDTTFGSNAKICSLLEKNNVTKTIDLLPSEAKLAEKTDSFIATLAYFSIKQAIEFESKRRNMSHFSASKGRDKSMYEKISWITYSLLSDNKQIVISAHWSHFLRI